MLETTSTFQKTLFVKIIFLKIPVALHHAFIINPTLFSCLPSDEHSIENVFSNNRSKRNRFDISKICKQSQLNIFHTWCSTLFSFSFVNKRIFEDDRLEQTITGGLHSANIHQWKLEVVMSMLSNSVARLTQFLVLAQSLVEIPRSSRLS